VKNRLARREVFLWNYVVRPFSRSHACPLHYTYIIQAVVSTKSSFDSKQINCLTPFLSLFCNQPRPQNPVFAKRTLRRAQPGTDPEELLLWPALF
jgi:hypothetical protein